jgi:cell division protein FtsB
MLRRAMPRRPLISKKSTQRFGASLVLVGLVFLGALIVVGFVERAYQEHQLNRAIERQRAENEAQKARNLELAGLADWSESDAAAELAARERLGMAREGEIVVLPTVVLPPAPTPIPPVTEALAQAQVDPLAPPTTNVERWAQAFFPPHAPDAP